ncbi:ABC transporter substrate-binding protein [Corynebacterium xerosis]|uniref:metal ABC transporter solute-binding protein, Zn/Mn family n=1 Tax=Corynebacterium xerosis TaxID=1725 RepID=UPI000EAF9568|nr:zinc ABC transporter substrate-binding protein [Corynebacterium xerosis]AYJ33663.1 ABC transporter substrate-binding protein [Corynebacterium xerosis]
MKTPFLRTALAASAAVGLTMGLAACSDDSATADGNGGDAGSGDTVKIVTSTKVWADVAQAVIGDAEGVEVEPIIASNDTDPHSYQPTAADMALVEQADVLLAGGGHYDAWLTEAASSDSAAIILTAIDGDGFDGHGHGEEGHAEEGHEGHDHSAEATDEEAHAEEGHGEEGHEGHDHSTEVNEHIWYNTDAVKSVASTLASEINAHWDIGASDEDVVKRLDEIDERKAKLPKSTTAQTHPLADDILAGTKIVDDTPEGYRRATLSESEPSAADVAAMLETIESGNLDFLIDAPQTRDQVSERLVKAAQAKGLRIVNVYESPGANESFFDLYDRILDDLEQE